MINKNRRESIGMYKGAIILLILFLGILMIRKLIRIVDLASNNNALKNHNKPSIDKPPTIRYYTKCGKSAKTHNPATTKALDRLNIRYIGDASGAILYMPCGYNYLESELAILNPNNINQVIFAVKGADQLCSKNKLWEKISGHWGRKRASEITPESWVTIDKLDMELFRQLPEYEYSESVFILKKNIQRKRGLKLVRGVSAAITIYEKDPAFRVIQRYIPYPLCINHRKLNIRIYVCIVCPGKLGQPIEWWLHPKGKCIYTAGEYVGDTEDNLDNASQHFTSFNLDANQTYRHDALPETLEQFSKYIGKTIYRQLWLDIIGKLSAIRQAYNPVVGSFNNKDMGSKMCFTDTTLNKHRCFQLFGVDIIIDTKAQQVNNEYNKTELDGIEIDGFEGTEEWEALVLEFNKGPEMSFKSPEDGNMKPDVMSDCIKLGLDKEKAAWERIP